MPTLLLLLLAVAAAAPPAGSFDQSLALAGSKKSDLLLWFGRESEEQVKERIAKLSPPPVLLAVDPLDGDLGSRLALRFNLHFVPAAILVGADGKEIERREEVAQIAKLPAWITAWRAGDGILSTLLKKEQENPNDPATKLKVAREFLSRGVLGEADKRLAVIIAEETEKTLVAEALLERGLLLLRKGRQPEAEQNLRLLCEDHAGTKASPEGELALARLLTIEGDRTAAAKILERFKERHPGDPRVREAMKLLRDLSPQ